jgi:hypothetical protein
MKLSPRPARIPSSLSQSTHYLLGSYALAATAAGVSMLALTQPSAAKVIYTKTNVDIFSLSYYPLDLNNDGKADFSFLGRWLSTSDCAVGSALNIAQVRPGNSVWRATSGAAVLRARVHVGTKAPFSGALTLLMGYAFEPCGFTDFRGPWENEGKGVKSRYLGLRFKIKGKNHYGWARLTVPGGLGGLHGATMTGYAYETVPNKSIITGKTKGPDVITVQPDAAPGSLGRLALGRKR